MEGRKKINKGEEEEEERERKRELKEERSCRFCSVQVRIMIFDHVIHFAIELREREKKKKKS